MRIQILGDSNLTFNWINGKLKINNQKFRTMVQKTQNMLDRTNIHPMGDHLDMFQHIYREWNQETDHLTHVAREKGATWNSYVMEEGSRLEAVRADFMEESTYKMITRSSARWCQQVSSNRLREMKNVQKR